ncbi:MAG: DMT family transporter [Bacteroidales bacterium]|nr:DMT family transporter [Bacteroidales bacterium]
MKFFDLNKKLWQWVLLIFVSFVWGLSFILMKRGLESYNEIQVGSFRIFFASIFLLPFLFKRLKKFKRKDLKYILIIGFIGNLFPAILFAKAQTEVNSSLAGMLNTSFPIIVLIIGSLFFGLKAKRHEIVGILLGLLGSVGIVLAGTSNLSGSNNLYALFILLAVIFYSISINVIKYKLPDLDGISITIFSFVIIGPVAGLFLFFTDFGPALATPDYLENLFYIALLALGGSAVSVTLFYLLMDYVDVIFASLSTYIIPLFAILWGLLDGETISLIQILFLGVIFMGVFLVNKNIKNNKKKKSGTD